MLTNQAVQQTPSPERISKTAFMCAIEMHNKDVIIDLKTEAGVVGLTLQGISEKQLREFSSLGDKFRDLHDLFRGSCGMQWHSDAQWKFDFYLEKRGYQPGQICYDKLFDGRVLWFDLLSADDYKIPIEPSQVVEVERIFRLAATCKALGLTEQFGNVGTL